MFAFFCEKEYLAVTTFTVPMKKWRSNHYYILVSILFEILVIVLFGLGEIAATPFLGITLSFITAMIAQILVLRKKN